MSSADDILFEPIGIAQVASNSPYKNMFDMITRALAGIEDYDFCVEPNIPVEVYDQIADLVENHQGQIDQVSNVVTYDPLRLHRPPTALTIRDVFNRIRNGDHRFWYCSKLGNVQEYKFENFFTISGGRPMVKLMYQDPSMAYWDWWAISLLSNFAGYSEHYAFGEPTHARQYYGIP